MAQTPITGSKVTLRHIEKMVADLGLTRRQIKVERCTMAPFAIDARQIRLSSYLESLGDNGSPLIVARPQGDNVEVVLGAYFLKLSHPGDTVSVLCAEMTDIQAVQIATLVGRDAYNPDRVALGRAYAGAMQALGIRSRALAALIGVSRPYISNHIALLTMPADVQQRVASGGISFTAARALMGLSGSDQSAMTEEIAVKQHSTRTVERLVQRKADNVILPTGRDSAKPAASAHLTQMNTLLSDRLGSPTALVHSENGGRLEIHFHDLETLGGVLDRLGSYKIPVTLHGTLSIALPTDPMMDRVLGAVIPEE